MEPEPASEPLDPEPADAAIPPEPDTPLALLSGLPDDEAPAELPESDAWEPACPEEQPPPKAAANANARIRDRKTRPWMKRLTAEEAGVEVSGLSSM